MHSGFFWEFLEISCLFSLSKKVQKTISRLREKTSAWKWSPRLFHLSKTAVAHILLFPIYPCKQAPFGKLKGRSHLPLADEHAGQQKAQIRLCLPLEGQIWYMDGLRIQILHCWPSQGEIKDRGPEYASITHQCTHVNVKGLITLNGVLLFVNVLFVCGRNRTGTNIALEVLHSCETQSIISTVGPSTELYQTFCGHCFFQIYDSLGPQFQPANGTRHLVHSLITVKLAVQF